MSLKPPIQITIVETRTITFPLTEDFLPQSDNITTEQAIIAASYLYSCDRSCLCNEDWQLEDVKFRVKS